MALATDQARTLADVVFPRRKRAWVRDISLAMSLFTALCARIAISLPRTPVLLTGALAMVFYLLEGLLGLPVFALGRSAWST